MNTLAPENEVLQSRMRVMIVEDDENVALAMAELLENLGFETQMVNDGAQAPQQAEVFRPEIVLLDIDLPGMNGYDVAKTLRKMPEMASILIIAITGHNEPDEKVQAYHVGMDLHLAKPLQVNFFKELIADLGKTLRRFAAVSL